MQDVSCGTVCMAIRVLPQLRALSEFRAPASWLRFSGRPSWVITRGDGASWGRRGRSWEAISGVGLWLPDLWRAR